MDSDDDCDLVEQIINQQKMEMSDDEDDLKEMKDEMDDLEMDEELIKRNKEWDLVFQALGDNKDGDNKDGGGDNGGGDDIEDNNELDLFIEAYRYENMKKKAMGNGIPIGVYDYNGNGGGGGGGGNINGATLKLIGGGGYSNSGPCGPSIESTEWISSTIGPFLFPGHRHGSQRIDWVGNFSVLWKSTKDTGKGSGGIYSNNGEWKNEWTFNGLADEFQ